MELAFNPGEHHHRRRTRPALLWRRKLPELGKGTWRPGLRGFKEGIERHHLFSLRQGPQARRDRLTPLPCQGSTSILLKVVLTQTLPARSPTPGCPVRQDAMKQWQDHSSWPDRSRTRKVCFSQRYGDARGLPRRHFVRGPASQGHLDLAIRKAHRQDCRRSLTPAHPARPVLIVSCQGMR